MSEGGELSVIPFGDEDEAVRIAEDSPYGLGGGVWTGRPRTRRGRRPPNPFRLPHRERGVRLPVGPVRPRLARDCLEAAGVDRREHRINLSGQYTQGAFREHGVRRDDVRPPAPGCSRGGPEHAWSVVRSPRASAGSTRPSTEWRRGHPHPLEHVMRGRRSGAGSSRVLGGAATAVGSAASCRR
ncbi:aldehyde dehydrogenase family protein [Nocardiopsis sp. B62]|uniref:aldehyde dehydrogenase family protein n=1 Tax=Nocardiopsis sp. B62 TaxID=2824874 RepID=UPI0027DC6012|nr:aldehyde dehydrogenase family protein [Nocardiopsis sp. B62]